YPLAAVSFDSAGNLYGTTSGSQTGAGSTLYTIDTTGVERVLQVLGSNKGGAGRPASRPLISDNGDIYGTNARGGPENFGSVWRFTSQGKFNSLWVWGNTNGSLDGEAPVAGLIRGKAGYLYGTTAAGGSAGVGTAFRISRTGDNFSVLHSFGPSPDGCN